MNKQNRLILRGIATSFLMAGNAAAQAPVIPASGPVPGTIYYQACETDVSVAQNCLNYFISFPKGYNGSANFPVLFFYPGSGERFVDLAPGGRGNKAANTSTNLSKAKTHGPLKYISKGGFNSYMDASGAMKDMPFIVVVPLTQSWGYDYHGEHLFVSARRVDTQYLKDANGNELHSNHIDGSAIIEQYANQHIGTNGKPTVDLVKRDANGNALLSPVVDMAHKGKGAYVYQTTPNGQIAYQIASWKMDPSNPKLYLYVNGERVPNYKLDSAGNKIPLLIFDPIQAKDYANNIIGPAIATGNDSRLVLKDLNNRFKVDNSRVYVTGLSMGGAGSFDATTQSNDLIAAAVPVSGYMGNPSSEICKAMNIPIWAQHGLDDTRIPYGRSVGSVNSINKCHANKADYQASVFLMPGGHTSSYWDSVYNRYTSEVNGTNIYAWMMSHSR